MCANLDVGKCATWYFTLVRIACGRFRNVNLQMVINGLLLLLSALLLYVLLFVYFVVIDLHLLLHTCQSAQMSVDCLSPRVPNGQPVLKQEELNTMNN